MKISRMFVSLLFLLAVCTTATASAAAFPTDEAGISAYVNVGKSIDLDLAKNAFVGTQVSADTYLIGIVGLDGMPEETYPHVYVSEDGWIFAYYSKYTPSAVIMQWHGYTGGAITTTTFEDAIATVCTEIGIGYASIEKSVRYYHFQYPTAKQIVLAAEFVDFPAPERDHYKEGTDSFNYMIPGNVTLYEASWEHYTYDSVESAQTVDGKEISRYGKTENDASVILYGLYGALQKIPDELHTVTMYHREYDAYYSSEPDFVGHSGVATAFVYEY